MTLFDKENRKGTVIGGLISFALGNPFGLILATAVGVEAVKEKVQEKKENKEALRNMKTNQEIQRATKIANEIDTFNNFNDYEVKEEA